MNKKNRFLITLIGAGRVGLAFTQALKKNGARIIGIYDILPKRIIQGYKFLGLKPRKLRPITESVQKSNLVLLATPDSEILKVYKEIYRFLQNGSCVVHFSGSLSSSLLPNPNKKQITTLSLHPIQTFPRTPVARRQKPNTKHPTRKAFSSPLSNSYFSIETNSQKCLAIGKKLVQMVSGKGFIILKSRDKPLYHTLCVFASNLLVAFFDSVLNLSKKIGLKPTQGWKILTPLINKTIENISTYGIVESLSGPVERGDIETVRSHIKVLNKRVGARSTMPLLYKILSRRAIKIADKKTKRPEFKKRLKIIGSLLR